MLITRSECSLQVAPKLHVPVDADQIRTVLSELEEAMWRPSGENRAVDIAPPCPARLQIELPVSGFQSRMIPSEPPETSCLPSGEKATLKAPSVHGTMTFTHTPVSASHTATFLSSAVAIWL